MAVTFRDSDGTTRLAGDLLIGGTTGDVATVQADGTVSPAPGGSLPTTREELSGNGVAIPPNSFDWLTWDSSGGPDAALDISVPAHPTIITAGVYCVSVVIRCNSGDPDGYFDVGLFLDRSNFNASQSVLMFGDPISGAVPDVSIAFCWYIPAGGKVEVGVTYTTPSGLQNSSSSIRSAHVQRLS